MRKKTQMDTDEHGLERAKGQFLVYQAEDGKLKLDVRLEDESVWLNQQLMADLFQTTKQNISLHIQNIYEEGELEPEATVKKYLTVRQEGSRKVKRLLDYYNLDMIISVGYRIKSHVATRFRIWATQKLTEFIKKGFVLDDERLKNPDLPFDYFEELERRIQDIRTSERRFYQKITDIYATSIDYDPTLDISIDFFKTVQNKMHWAITGQTAAEIIHSRADAKKSNMGLTNYRGAKVRKQDVTIAKNYLNEEELAALRLMCKVMSGLSAARSRGAIRSDHPGSFRGLKPNGAKTYAKSTCYHFNRLIQRPKFSRCKSCNTCVNRLLRSK